MENSVVRLAERIASDFLLEQVKSSYQILGKGITNQVCVVETESRKVVVRMNDKDTFPSYIKKNGVSSKQPQLAFLDLRYCSLV